MAEDKNANHIKYDEPAILAPCGGLLLDENDFEIKEIGEREYISVKGGGGGGTTNYEELDNKPKINGSELIGDKTSEELGITDGVWEFSVSGVAPSFVSDKPYADIKQAIDDGYNVVCNYGGFKFPLLKDSGGSLDFGGVAQIVETDGEDNARIFDVTISASSIAVDEAVVGLRMASATVLGGVKVGDGLEIDTNGVLSVESAEDVYFTVEGTLDGSGNVTITTLWADLETAYSDGKAIRLLLNGNKEIAFAGREGGIYKFECADGDGLDVSVESIKLKQDSSIATKIAANRSVTALKDDAPFIIVASNDDTVNKKYGTFTDVGGTVIGIAQVGQALDEGREVILKVAIPEASLNTVDFRIERIYASGTDKNIFFYAVNDITDSKNAIRRITMSTNASIHGQYIDYIIPDNSNDNCVITFTNSGGTITPPSDPAKWTELEEAYTTGRFIEGSISNEKLTFARKEPPNTYVFTKESLVQKLDEAGRASYEQLVTEIKWDGSSTPISPHSGNANEFATFVIEPDGDNYKFVDFEGLAKFNGLNHQRVALVYNNALYLPSDYDNVNNIYTFSNAIVVKDGDFEDVSVENFKLNATTGAITNEIVSVQKHRIVEITRGTSGSWGFALTFLTWNWATVKRCMDGGNLVYLHDGEQNFFVPTHTATNEHIWECFKIERVATDDGGMRDALVRYTASIKDDEEKKWTRTQFDYAHKTVAMITVDGTDPTVFHSSKTSAEINTSNGAGNIVTATHNGNIYQLVSSIPSSAQFVATTYDNTKGEFTDHYIYVNGSAVAVVDKPRLECIPVIRYKTNTSGVAHAGFYPVYATEVLNQTNTYKFIAEDLPVPVDPAGVKTFVAWHIDSESGDVAAVGNAILDDVVLYTEWTI